MGPLKVDLKSMQLCVCVLFKYMSAAHQQLEAKPIVIPPHTSIRSLCLWAELQVPLMLVQLSFLRAVILGWYLFIVGLA